MSSNSISGGMVIVFEGIDGVGKSTQLKLAQDQLSKEGWEVSITRNLGGTPIGEELRRVIKSPLPRPTETNLYISLAIQEALLKKIAEERKGNGLILMDRGPLSLAAYEIYGSGLDATLGWQHVDDGMSKLRPELTIVYMAEVNTALARLDQSSQADDYFESKPPEYFEDVSQGYREAAERYQGSTVIIDANQPIETVHRLTIVSIEQAISQKQDSDKSILA